MYLPTHVYRDRLFNRLKFLYCIINSEYLSKKGKSKTYRGTSIDSTTISYIRKMC